MLNERKKEKRQSKTKNREKDQRKTLAWRSPFLGGRRAGGNNPFPQRFRGEKNPAVLAEFPFQLPLSVLIGDSPHHTETLWR